MITVALRFAAIFLRRASFSCEQTGRHASSLVPAAVAGTPAMNIRGSQLKIGDLSNDRGKRDSADDGATADADHPRKLDEGIADWLNEDGAKADFIYLGDRGITGNGHMMMLEKQQTALGRRDHGLDRGRLTTFAVSGKAGIYRGNRQMLLLPNRKVTFLIRAPIDPPRQESLCLTREPRPQ